MRDPSYSAVFRPPLTAEERGILDVVRQIVADRIAPSAALYDATAEFPWANIQALNASGLNGMFVPEAFGGAGLSYLAYLCCLMEISGACASTGLIWATNFHALQPIMGVGTEEQKQRWLPVILKGGLAALAITEPSCGSDAAAMTTRFRREGDFVRVDGSKAFITNGDVADFCVVFGKWSDLGSGGSALSAIVIERGTSGFEVVGLEKKLGHRASSTAALAFDDCRVPIGNLLGAPGEGRPLLLSTLNKSRPSVAAHALAITRSALSDAVAFANERRVAGLRVMEHQANKFLLADLSTELTLCETLLWAVAAGIDDGATDLAIQSAMLKLRSGDLAMRATSEAVQLCGGYGYCQGMRLERLMRDAKLMQIGEGTGQILRDFIGGTFVRRESDDR